MTEPSKKTIDRRFEEPYPPSWIDQLTTWLDRLPGPAWLYYGLALIAAELLMAVVFWIDGSVPPGALDPELAFFMAFVVYWPALYHYLSHAGSDALKSFRPLLDADDRAFARTDYELKTLPRWMGWVAIPAGIVLAAGLIGDDPAPFGDIVPLTPIPQVVDFVVTSLLLWFFLCVIARSIRQLRLVHRLHQQVGKIHLLNLEPAHAFSGLTARTGIGLVLVLIASYALDPGALSSTLERSTFLATVSVAIAVFALPVIGLRERIQSEKERAIRDASELLESATSELHEKIRKHDYAHLEGTEAGINALSQEIERLRRVRTWPWNTGTIRGFASTLLLPIFLWLVTRVLERFV